jgi:hypothetical protein
MVHSTLVSGKGPPAAVTGGLGAPTLKILGKSGDFPIWTFRLARQARVLPRKRTASKGEASEVTGSVVPGSQNWWSCTPARTPGMSRTTCSGKRCTTPFAYGTEVCVEHTGRKRAEILR